MTRRRPAPEPQPVTLSHLKIGHRVLRARDRVKIKDERGLFKILYFSQDGTEVFVHGGPPQRERRRTFKVDRIGTRPTPATLERKGVRT